MQMGGIIGRVRRLFGRGELDCKEIRDLSSEYLDDSLPSSIGNRFRAHIDDCHNCNAFVATLRATVLTLRDLPRHSASPALRERIQRGLEESLQEPPPTN